MASSSAPQAKPPTPHGVYLWKDGCWVAVDRSAINGDGVYVIYFSNSECGACRVFDSVWYPFVESAARKASARFIVVVCGWFARECSSESARSLFKEFNVRVSPTVVVLKRSNGKVERLIKHEGLTSSLALAFAYANIIGGESSPIEPEAAGRTAELKRAA